jgi:hypothetical protein
VRSSAALRSAYRSPRFSCRPPVVCQSSRSPVVRAYGRTRGRQGNSPGMSNAIEAAQIPPVRRRPTRWKQTRQSTTMVGAGRFRGMCVVAFEATIRRNVAHQKSGGVGIAAPRCASCPSRQTMPVFAFAEACSPARDIARS